MLQPVKSVIVVMLYTAKLSEEINIAMNGGKMPVVKEAIHINMWISRSEDSQKYNGLDPDTSIHLLQTYVLPVLVYGLEVLLPRKVLLEKA